MFMRVVRYLANLDHFGSSVDLHAVLSLSIFFIDHRTLNILQKTPKFKEMLYFTNHYTIICNLNALYVGTYTIGQTHWL